MSAVARVSGWHRVVVQRGDDFCLLNDELGCVRGLVRRVRRQLRALEREPDELAEDLAAERRATIALADDGNVAPLHRHDRPDT